MDMATTTPAQQADGTSIKGEVGGNRLTLLPGGKERLDAILDLIGSAKEHLRLLYYMFTDDQAGEAVRDALVDAAGRGVHVDLLVDGFGCGGVKEEFLADLKAAGGSYCIFHPSYGRRYLIRNHQKLALADGKVALIGGSNINLEYLCDDRDDRWRDLWLKIEGPACDTLLSYFDDIFAWTRKDGARMRELRRIIQRHSHEDGPVAWRFSGPMRRRNPFPGSLARDLDGAKLFDVVVAYFSPSWAMLRRIYRVAARGTARVVNAAKSDNGATIAAARYLYPRLMRRRVEVYEYQPAKLHTKLYIVDDVTYIGSSNFDFRSLYINLEMMLRIDDAAFAVAMRKYVDGEIADSVRITPELHAARTTPWRRFKRWIAHWLVTTVDYTVSRKTKFGVE